MKETVENVVNGERARARHWQIALQCRDWHPLRMPDAQASRRRSDLVDLTRHFRACVFAPCDTRRQDADAGKGSLIDGRSNIGDHLAVARLSHLSQGDVEVTRNRSGLTLEADPRSPEVLHVRNLVVTGILSRDGGCASHRCNSLGDMR